MIEFDHGGRRWTLTAGRFDDGRLAEVFIHGTKDSPLLAMAQDSAIMASIALQHGCPADVVAHPLAGREDSPLAKALALVQDVASAE